MAKKKTRAPAIEGWFTLDPEKPALLGTRCKLCRCTFFPKETLYCRNPACSGKEFDEIELSRIGRVWSFTNNCYAPPAPYVSPDPFVPYGIAAVELAEEKMVVLGQLATGTDMGRLSVGAEVELILETLFEDEEHEYLVWKWKLKEVGHGE